MNSLRCNICITVLILILLILISCKESYQSDQNLPVEKKTTIRPPRKVSNSTSIIDCLNCWKFQIYCAAPEENFRKCNSIRLNEYQKKSQIGKMSMIIGFKAYAFDGEQEELWIENTKKRYKLTHTSVLSLYEYEFDKYKIDLGYIDKDLNFVLNGVRYNIPIDTAVKYTQISSCLLVERWHEDTLTIRVSNELPLFD